MCILKGIMPVPVLYISVEQCHNIVILFNYQVKILSHFRISYRILTVYLHLRISFHIMQVIYSITCNLIIKIIIFMIGDYSTYTLPSGIQADKVYSILSIID